LWNQGLLSNYGAIDRTNANGTVSLSFADADVVKLGVGICALQPEACVFVGLGATVYVAAAYLPTIVDAIIQFSQKTSRAYAPKYATYNTGKNSNGGCNDPDPSKNVKWKGTEDPNNEHWHYITWNVNPDCEAFPDYQISAKDPGDAYREIFPR